MFCLGTDPKSFSLSEAREAFEEKYRCMMLRNNIKKYNNFYNCPQPLESHITLKLRI